MISTLPLGGVKLPGGLQGVVVSKERLEPIPCPRVTSLRDRDDVVYLGGQGVDPFRWAVATERLIEEDGATKKPALGPVDVPRLVALARPASGVFGAATPVGGRTTAARN